MKYNLLMDAYELNMAETYLLEGKHKQETVFDIFFRKIPNGAGFMVMAGLEEVIKYLKELHFDEADLNYLKECGYVAEFIDYLRNFKFSGDIKAIVDGMPIFPNEPLVVIKAPLIEAQLIETALLTILNGSINHASAARQIVEVLPEGKSLLEFGARRADGLSAAFTSSYYALMAGCQGTSNVLCAKHLGISALGTMAHSFIQSYNDELEAFIAFGKHNPDNCFLLVDTYDTLRSGLPNAIKAFDYLQREGYSLKRIGIRIDSGDLAYLSKQARKMLDEAGYEKAQICLSNGLNAQTIASLSLQGACFDSLGVGDNIASPEGRVGAVYKEVALFEDGKEIPKIKVSNDLAKTINPGYKNLYRLYDNDSGYALADVMCLHEEVINKDSLLVSSVTDFEKQIILNNYVIKELHQEVFKRGELIYQEPTFKEKQDLCNKEMNLLYPEVKRVSNPHTYYVDGTEAYIEFKKEMIKDIRRKLYV